MDKLGDHLGPFQSGQVIPTLNSSAPEPEEELTAEEKEARFMRRAGIFSLKHTFETFEPRPGTAKAGRAFRLLAEGKTDKPFLLCCGGTGNGKTHLIEALIIALARRNVLARYQTVAEMMDAIRLCLKDRPGMPCVEEQTREIAHHKTLILDDWGVEKGSDWECSRLEMIIDYRYRARLLTVMASNKDFKQLEQISPRIISRFSDPDVSQLVLNDGTDYRRRKV